MSAKTRHNRISARRRLPAFILVLLVVALCIAGVIYKGAEVTQVNVNDGGIWVTNKSKHFGMTILSKDNNGRGGTKFLSLAYCRRKRNRRSRGFHRFIRYWLEV